MLDGLVPKPLVRKNAHGIIPADMQRFNDGFCHVDERHLISAPGKQRADKTPPDVAPAVHDCFHLDPLNCPFRESSSIPHAPPSALAEWFEAARVSQTPASSGRRRPPDSHPHPDRPHSGPSETSL
ncbi:hypothetical protein SDC9_115103 [bioreactor metagenome]|uniref:Uncharacterized protein n=1 Tax=bioreactor metagenome TaxID=1076179 RepID=A0A645BSF7_9ZZZZ